MEYDEILRRFDVRQRSRDHCQCICPCHNDRKASLSVSHRDGRTLLLCHAGCATEHVLASAGLTMRDLFDEPLHSAGGHTEDRKDPQKQGAPEKREDPEKREEPEKPEKQEKQKERTAGKKQRSSARAYHIYSDGTHACAGRRYVVKK